MGGTIDEIGREREYPDLDGGAPPGGPPDPAAAARQGNAAATARLHAFVAGDATFVQCLDAIAPGFDFDHCSISEVAQPVLFRRQDGDADAVDPRDVAQGRLGDCYLLAPLAALAGTPDGRALLRGMVIENKATDGGVGSYTVTFHEPCVGFFGKTTFRDVPIHVSGPYLSGHTKSRDATGPTEVWPLVIEKAYAQYMGGYREIALGGSPAQPMTLLTGRVAKEMSLDWLSRMFNRYGASGLQADLASGHLVILNTKNNVGSAPGASPSTAKTSIALPDHGLVEKHAYVVTGTEQHAGKTFLRLGNPWGDTDPRPIPIDELTTWFSKATVGSIKP